MMLMMESASPYFVAVTTLETYEDGDDYELKEDLYFREMMMMMESACSYIV